MTHEPLSRLTKMHWSQDLSMLRACLHRIEQSLGNSPAGLCYICICACQKYLQALPLGRALGDESIGLSSHGRLTARLQTCSHKATFQANHSLGFAGRHYGMWLTSGTATVSLESAVIRSSTLPRSRFTSLTHCDFAQLSLLHSDIREYC